MINYISRVLNIYGHALVYIDLYGLKVEPDPKRASRVQAVIDSMGDKYLLARPVNKLRRHHD